MLPTLTKYEVFVFDKVNTSVLEIGKPYCLIEKQVTFENGADSKDTCFFAPLDNNGNVITDKVIKAVTSWWSQDASFKDARLIGHITSQTTYDPMKPLS